MACSFSANQYEHEFTAKQLGNWEVPKWHPKRPEQHKKPTKIISNDRGHLLPGVDRPTNSPWGHFRGTWQLPSQITRELANELTKPPVGFSRWALPSTKRSAKKSDENKTWEELGEPKAAETGDSYYADECGYPIIGGDTNIDENNFFQGDESTEHKKKVSKILEYTPGDLTSPRSQHPSRDLLIKQRDDRRKGKPPRYKLNDLYLEKHDCTDQVALLNEQAERLRDPETHVLGDDVSDNFKQMRLHNRSVAGKPHENGPPTPIVPAYCNFIVAKKMAQENLEHQPLPDAVIDLAYRKLQAEGHINPGIALNVQPIATGVGVKSYKAGPTQCTKLRVYRPKTCGVVPHVLDRSKMTDRPQTSFTKKDNLGAMDLAICWDYRPTNPCDEPKRPTHIDGSNGSAAPAVFTLVKTPRTPTNMETGRSGGVFSNTMGDGNFFDRDVVRRAQDFARQHEKGRICTCGTSATSFRSEKGIRVNKSPQSKSHEVAADKEITYSEHINPEKLRYARRSKSSPNLSEMAQIVADSLKDGTKGRCNDHEKMHCKTHWDGMTAQEKQDRHHHHHRHRHHHHHKKAEKTPRLCQMSKAEKMICYPEDVQLKPEFKQAFKAGIPNSNSSGTCTSFDSGCGSSSTSSSSSGNCCNGRNNADNSKLLRVPKPRLPYSKKNYNIETLAPPFASWKGGAGQGGYPDHWRLASVYQHAYKPIEARKRPLLQTVFQ